MRKQAVRGVSMVLVAAGLGCLLGGCGQQEKPKEDLAKLFMAAAKSPDGPRPSRRASRPSHRESTSDPYGVAGMDCPPSLSPDTLGLRQQINDAVAAEQQHLLDQARKQDEEAMRQWQADNAQMHQQDAAMGLPMVPDFVQPVGTVPTIVMPEDVIAKSPELREVSEEIDRRQAAYEDYLQRELPDGYRRMVARRAANADDLRLNGAIAATEGRLAAEDQKWRVDYRQHGGDPDHWGHH